MKKFLTLLPLFLLPAVLLGQPASRQPFGEGWRLRHVQELTPREAQTGFNDYGWQSVDLPHDWSVEMPEEAAPGQTRRLVCTGKAWYRKHLPVSEQDLKGNLFLELDGAMSDPEVWVNGVRAAACPGADVPFQVDLTPFLKTGDNVIAISVNNRPDRGSIHPGGGINRSIWLSRVPKAGVAPWGGRMEVRLPEENGGDAALQLHLLLRNSDAPVAARVVTRIYPDLGDVHSEPVASAETRVDALADSTCLVQDFALAAFRTWSPGDPALYRAVTTVSTPYGDDVYVTRFGARQPGAEPALHGVRIYPDLGALGNVWMERLWKDRLLALKAQGCNCLSLNVAAPAPELLDLCDRLGLLLAADLPAPLAAEGCNHPCLLPRSEQTDFAVYGFASTDGTLPGKALFTSAGFPTDACEQFRGGWQPETPRVRVVTLQPGRDGTVSVIVTTNGDSGVLYLDGRSQGFRKANPETGILRWNALNVGDSEMQVVIYRNGRIWARQTAEPTGEAVALVWTDGIETVSAGGFAAGPAIYRIPVSIVDAEGRTVAGAAPEVEFTLVGPGRIVATDSGDPASDAPYPAQKIRAYQGNAAVYIYKKGDEKVILSVRSPGLKGLRLEL